MPRVLRKLEPIKVCIFGQAIEIDKIGQPILQNSQPESGSF